MTAVKPNAVDTAGGERSAGATRRSEVRADIQGLRAIAVSSVLLYHLWPGRLGGGFVGVDVFLVISGFLITSHLLRAVPTGPRDLVDFWSRRIRRLLPASLLVLVLTTLAARVFLPETQWTAVAAEVRAAALYVVNWRLADDSVDYLARDNAPSPVQHFWSLSVEEQFYLGWPVLILALALLARRTSRRPAVVVLAGVATVVLASLAFSVHETQVAPARAYFVTPTRIWELAVGGLLAAAVAVRRGPPAGDPGPASRRVLRPALAWLGLGAIAWAVFTYDSTTPFPGWRAAVPVLGAAAVIAANAPVHRASPTAWFALRPVQWLGDVSYSIYLWHWPLIVLVPAALDHRLDRGDKLAIVAASLVLAWLTKLFVEDRFRTARWARPRVKPYALAALGMALVVGAALALGSEATHRREVAQQQLAHTLAHPTPCLGAAALAAPDGKCGPTTRGRLTPSPIEAAHDRSDAYAAGPAKENCFSFVPRFPDKTCTFGPPDGSVRVALVGNSHAGEWLPALQRVAGASHWRITTYLASQCSLSEVKQVFDTASHSQACLDWVRRTTQRIARAKYDLVVMVNRVSVRVAGTATISASQRFYQRGYESVLRAFAASRTPVLVIRDTPAPGTSVPDCLEAHTGDYTKCDGSRSAWLPGDPTIAAVRTLNDPRVSSIDLTRYICPSERCPAVIGGVPVYFDGSHLTATYASTLAPYLAPSLRAGLRHGR